MAVRRPEPGAIARVVGLLDDGADVPRNEMAEAARAVAAALGQAHPGHTIEVRVPPFAAVQVGSLAGDGPSHHRGTPPNVVELAPATAVRLAAGSLGWDDAVANSLVRYSGAHASDVAAMLPL